MAGIADVPTVLIWWVGSFNKIISLAELVFWSNNNSDNFQFPNDCTDRVSMASTPLIIKQHLLWSCQSSLSSVPFLDLKAAVSDWQASALH